jgi:hypothetical protein
MIFYCFKLSELYQQFYEQFECTAPVKSEILLKSVDEGGGLVRPSWAEEYK